MISTKYTIREQNESQILSQIIHNREISRAELASITKLNKASVSSITKSLLENHLILEIGIGNASSAGGRKPTMITFNGTAAMIIAIDLGVDYIEGMLAFIDGTIIETRSQKHLTINSKNVFDYLYKIITDFSENAQIAPHGIVGMTIAIHGIVSENKILFTPYYDIDTLDMYTELSKQFDFPIFLENEANLTALGEYTFSSKSQKIVSLSIHSGVGAGIVEDGIIQTGENGVAGEIGHTILFPHGKKCPCGNEGCLEQYISHKALYQNIRDVENFGLINSDLVKKLYTSNHPEVTKLLDENADFLSIGINNTIMFYNPEVVIINSSIYRKIPGLISRLKNNLKSNYAKDISIQNTNLGDRSTLFGGIALAAQNFLNIQSLKLSKNKT